MKRLYLDTCKKRYLHDRSGQTFREITTAYFYDYSSEGDYTVPEKLGRVLWEVFKCKFTVSLGILSNSFVLLLYRFLEFKNVYRAQLKKLHNHDAIITIF